MSLYKEEIDRKNELSRQLNIARNKLDRTRNKDVKLPEDKNYWRRVIHNYYYEHNNKNPIVNGQPYFRIERVELI